MPLLPTSFCNPPSLPPHYGEGEDTGLCDVDRGLCAVLIVKYLKVELESGLE